MIQKSFKKSNIIYASFSDYTSSGYYLMFFQRKILVLKNNQKRQNNKITTRYNENKLLIIHHFNDTFEYSFFCKNLTLETHQPSFRWLPLSLQSRYLYMITILTHTFSKMKVSSYIFFWMEKVIFFEMLQNRLWRNF